MKKLNEDVPTNNISSPAIAKYDPLLKVPMARRLLPKDKKKPQQNEETMPTDIELLFEEFESSDLLVEAVNRTVKGPKSDRNLEHLARLRKTQIAAAKARGSLDPNWSQETKAVVQKDAEAKAKAAASAPTKKHIWTSLEDEDAFRHHARQYALTGDQNHRTSAMGYHTAVMQRDRGHAVRAGGDMYHAGAEHAWVDKRAKARMAELEIADKLHGHTPPKKPGFFKRLKNKIFGEDAEVEVGDLALFLVDEIERLVDTQLVNEQIAMKAKSKFLR